MGSFNNDYVCPFKKNSLHKLTNCSITDKNFPLLTAEMKFKIESKLYGMIKGKRGWTYLYEFQAFARFKRNFVLKL